MNAQPQSAAGDRPPAPALNDFFDDPADAAPVRAESAYDFFGNSELLVTAG